MTYYFSLADSDITFDMLCGWRMAGNDSDASGQISIRIKVCFCILVYGTMNLERPTRAQVYETLLMLNLAENEICSAYKKLNTNNSNFSCKAEMSMIFFPANIY